MPLGWALYLPEEWCEDSERRAQAKIPEEVAFKTKPELGVELLERASGWKVPKAPVLGDAAYGDNSELRERLHDAELQYVLSVGAETTVFAPGDDVRGARAQGRYRPPARPASPRPQAGSDRAS